MMARKWCFVPGCTNTTKKNPAKIFLSVPKQMIKRKKWFAAVRRDIKEVSSASTLYCCEDHFNLEEDMENYLEYKLSKVKAHIKGYVVPHIFTCQPDKALHKTTRSTSEKRAQKRKIHELLCISTSTESLELVPEPSTSRGAEIDIQPSNSKVVLEARCDVATQTGIFIHYRSKGVQVSFSTSNKDTATSPVKCEIPLNKPEIRKIFQSDSDDSSIDTTKTSDTDTEWHPNADSSEDEFTPEDQKLEDSKFRSMFVRKIETRLRMYTGIPKEYQNFINILEKRSSLKKYFIYLTLYKIKRNSPFQEIGDLFGISKTYASAIFGRSILLLAKLMEQLIYWPSSDSIKRNLPIQFRMSFYNVQSIIDCLEIEIEKPSAAVGQSLTWSEYKKCNTIKYLISCTPDGFINFISCGYGGRANDAAIFEDCGYLNVLPENCVVMADRGFKQIETLLCKKKCTMVRPPSVASNVKMTKDDVLLTKRIASVRIHIERVINRIRHFKMLGPHATISSAMVPKLDYIVLISCAIINLQKPIIKQ